MKKIILGALVLLLVSTITIIIFPLENDIEKASKLIKTVTESVAKERQQNILQGNFNPIIAIGNSKNVFENFILKDEDKGKDIDTGVKVLEDRTIPSIKKANHFRFSNGWYIYCLNDNCTDKKDGIWFTIRNGKLVCQEKNTDYGKCSVLNVLVENKSKN